MLLNEEKHTGKYIIHSYKPGKVVINDREYINSVILSPIELIADWPPQSIQELTEADLEVMVLQRPELILLGTGEKQHFPAITLLRVFIEKNIGYEIMDTGAACRTYNLLISENRKVVAGLLIR